MEVDLEGDVGFVLSDDLELTPTPEPWVALLPSLDSTTMGWQARHWYLGSHKASLFDSNGNAGPTIWVDGRIVGGFGDVADGEVVTKLLEDVGREEVRRWTPRPRVWPGGSGPPGWSRASRPRSTRSSSGDELARFARDASTVVRGAATTVPPDAAASGAAGSTPNDLTHGQCQEGAVVYCATAASRAPGHLLRSGGAGGFDGLGPPADRTAVELDHLRWSWPPQGGLRRTGRAGGSRAPSSAPSKPARRTARHRPAARHRQWHGVSELDGSPVTGLGQAYVEEAVGTAERDLEPRRPVAAAYSPLALPSNWKPPPTLRSPLIG